MRVSALTCPPDTFRRVNSGVNPPVITPFPKEVTSWLGGGAGRGSRAERRGRPPAATRSRRTLCPVFPVAVPAGRAEPAPGCVWGRPGQGHTRGAPHPAGVRRPGVGVSFPQLPVEAEASGRSVAVWGGPQRGPRQRGRWSGPDPAGRRPHRRAGVTARTGRAARTGGGAVHAWGGQALGGRPASGAEAGTSADAAPGQPGLLEPPAGPPAMGAPEGSGGAWDAGCAPTMPARAALGLCHPPLCRSPRPPGRRAHPGPPAWTPARARAQMSWGLQAGETADRRLPCAALAALGEHSAPNCRNGARGAQPAPREV